MSKYLRSFIVLFVFVLACTYMDKQLLKGWLPQKKTVHHFRVSVFW